MHQHSRRAVVLAVVAAALIALTAPALARADTVRDWNVNAATALAAQDARVANIHLAMVHGAMYDAVNAIDGRYQPYLNFHSPPTAGASQDAAAARAAYRILSHLFPANEGTYLSQYNASVAGIPAVARDAGAAVGEAAAGAMIAARTGDGRFGAAGFVLPAVLEPGDWRPLANGNDPAAWIRDVEPFLIGDPNVVEHPSALLERFLSTGPWPLDSPQYAREFNEVKTMGSNAADSPRTADQTNGARYWAANGPATWTRILRTVADAHGLALADSARLYAMFYLTIADTLVTVWRDKAHWLFWRPVTAIQLAGTDGNDATEPAAAWAPLIATPPYPDHSSGLSGFSAAACGALVDFFGTDKLAWTDTNPLAAAAGPRTFTRCSDAVAEVVDVRVWSGLHFRKADEDGARIGRDVAKWREHHHFQRMPGTPGGRP